MNSLDDSKARQSPCQAEPAALSGRLGGQRSSGLITLEERLPLGQLVRPGRPPEDATAGSIEAIAVAQSRPRSSRISARRSDAGATIGPFIMKSACEATVVAARSPLGTAGSGKSNAWKTVVEGAAEHRAGRRSAGPTGRARAVAGDAGDRQVLERRRSRAASRPSRCRAARSTARSASRSSSASIRRRGIRQRSRSSGSTCAARSSQAVLIR